MLCCVRMPPVSGWRSHPGPVAPQRLAEERSASASSGCPAALPNHCPSSQKPSVCHHTVCWVPERTGRHRPGAQYRTGPLCWGVASTLPAAACSCLLAAAKPQAKAKCKNPAVSFCVSMLHVYVCMWVNYANNAKNVVYMCTFEGTLVFFLEELDSFYIFLSENELYLSHLTMYFVNLCKQSLRKHLHYREFICGNKQLQATGLFFFFLFG